MIRGNIDTSNPLCFFIQETPLHRRFGAAKTPIGPCPAALQQNRGALKSELNVIADTVVQIDRRRIERGFIGRCSKATARLISHFPSPGVPGSSVIMGGPPCANKFDAAPARTAAKASVARFKAHSGWPVNEKLQCVRDDRGLAGDAPGEVAGAGWN